MLLPTDVTSVQVKVDELELIPTAEPVKPLQQPKVEPPAPPVEEDKLLLILKEIKETLRYGWTRKTLRDNYGRHCVVGAIHKATPPTPTVYYGPTGNAVKLDIAKVYRRKVMRAIKREAGVQTAIGLMNKNDSALGSYEVIGWVEAAIARRESEISK